ncbi:MAG: hypothetical protein QGF38_03940, partial [Rhodospirillales bacterium]|nr:hypothetical protein [Rhodospirillales bacterium]
TTSRPGFGPPRTPPAYRSSSPLPAAPLRERRFARPNVKLAPQGSASSNEVASNGTLSRKSLSNVTDFTLTTPVSLQPKFSSFPILGDLVDLV